MNRTRKKIGENPSQILDVLQYFLSCCEFQTGTPDGRLLTMYRFENMTIESYDVSNVTTSENSLSESKEEQGDPSYITGLIKGTNRYVAYGSSKNQVGVWDMARRKHVRCVGIRKLKIMDLNW